MELKEASGVNEMNQHVYIPYIIISEREREKLQFFVNKKFWMQQETMNE